MGNSDAKLLLIGLDNSGKTTVLHRLAYPEGTGAKIIPTIGFEKCTFSRGGVDFQVYDMSGESKYRDLWQSNASVSKQEEIQGIIFVVDASDRMRLKTAKYELDLFLENVSIPAVPYLFYANKSDVKGCCRAKEVETILGLEAIKRNYQVVECSGLSGLGIEAGMGWLLERIKQRMKPN